MSQTRSKLVRMFVRNIGCIGNEGISVALDNVVCIVGQNNSGKSTILRAYELAQGEAKFDWANDRCAQAPDDEPSEVILDVHIPAGIGNVGEEWKQPKDDLLIVSSRWRWYENLIGESKKFPIRSTKNPAQAVELNDGYAEEGKAGGADNVFKSCLPKPVRIGTRNDPAEAEKALMKLVLEPVSSALSIQATMEDTGLAKTIAALSAHTMKIVEEQESQFSEAIAQVQDGFASIFRGLTVKLEVQAAPPKFDVSQLIKDGSGLRITDNGSEVQLAQQGAGAQRALFWTMLQVHIRLDAEKKRREKVLDNLEKGKKKKGITTEEQQEIQFRIDEIDRNFPLPRDPDDPALPGYILLIDEPENALHPLAARAAQRRLYELAEEKEWQVMMTTHSPLFINPAVDHTTILRLERGEGAATKTPQTYRSDDADFSDDDKQVLRAIQDMDPTFCEVFFGSYPIVVEGDTEHAAFLAAVVEERHELIDQVTIIKARGKPQIRAILKMLMHFKKDFGIVHDSDWPHGKNEAGTRAKSNQWAHNKAIRDLVVEAKSKNIKVVHEICLPDFERHIGMERGSVAKPFEAYMAIRNNPDLKTRVQALLSRLKNEGEGQQNWDAGDFVDCLIAELRKKANQNGWEDKYRLDSDG